MLFVRHSVSPYRNYCFKYRNGSDDIMVSEMYRTNSNHRSWNKKKISTLYNVCAVPWGCSVLWGDIMSTVGGYHEYRGVFCWNCPTLVTLINTQSSFKVSEPYLLNFCHLTRKRVSKARQKKKSTKMCLKYII